MNTTLEIGTEVVETQGTFKDCAFEYLGDNRGLHKNFGERTLIAPRKVGEVAQLIRSNSGDTLIITEGKLIEVHEKNEDEELYFAYLRDLGEDKHMFPGHCLDFPQGYIPMLSMDWAKRQIGCQEFNEENFSILAEAIRAALKG
jgi:hypothetical protein